MNMTLTYKMQHLRNFISLILVVVLAALNSASIHAEVVAAKADDGKGKSGVMWINHFGMVSGNSNELRTSANSTSSGIGDGLTGLVLQSGPDGTPGDTFSNSGAKVVQTALVLPKNTQISKIRVCYENSASSSYITEVGLIQVNDPPSSGVVKLDDKTDLNANAPSCVDSKAAKPAIKSKDGPVLLLLRVNLANSTDRIVIRGLGLIVK